MMRKIVLLCSLLIVIFSNGQENDRITQLIPTNNQGVEKNDLLELKIPLDSTSMNGVLTFLEHPGRTIFNPYDPEIIDIQAVFYLKQGNNWLRKGKTYGFFFQDFKRDTTGNIESWKWSKIPSSERFLVRYAPNEPGEWKVEVQRIIKQRDTLQPMELIFTCIDSDIEGKMTTSGTHFQVDGKTFVPIGNNLSHPRWIDDPNTLRQGTSEYWYDIHKMPAMPIAFTSYLNDIEKFASAGGNYFRMMHFPFVNDIEFEHLNNYTNRLHLAWETDQIIRTCEKNKLRIHFVITWANELNSPERTFNKLFWDWWANDYPWVNDDYGYCYQAELSLKEPYEFLTDSRATTIYKKKLRYIFSRWGYSNAIGTIELMNEINLVFPDHPRERMYWQKEMSGYLKHDFEIDHPIGVNYGGVPDIAAGDSSYFLPDIDVISFNEYRVPDSRSNFIYHLQNYRSINKPFLFSEIGQGSGELTTCEKYSEWLKDAWMTTLSGMAGMGLEWTQQRNFELMEKYYPVIQDFIRGEDLARYNQFESDMRNDHMAEVIAIKDPVGGKALGVVQNTTWNFYTNRKNDDNPCGQTLPKEDLREFEDVRDRIWGNALHLTGMSKRTDYIVTWYDAQTGKQIEITEDKSNRSGKVRLRIPDLDINVPLMVFKLKKK